MNNVAYRIAESVAFGAFGIAEKMPWRAARFLGFLVAMPIAMCGVVLSIPFLAVATAIDMWEHSA